jgi:electron transfer flavoprotein alpha subunit
LVRALVVADVSRGEVHPVTAELISAAATVTQEITVGVVAQQPSLFRESITRDGVVRILEVPIGAAALNSSVYQDAVSYLITTYGFELAVIGFTNSGIAYGAAVAAPLGLGFASGVTSISLDNKGLVVERPVFGGKALETLDFPGHDRHLVLLRQGSYPPAVIGGTPVIEEVRVPLRESGVEHLEFLDREEEDVDITNADFILAIGRGVSGQQEVAVFEELATAMGATLACSRPLVDAGLLHTSRQIGTSGGTVRTRAYLGFGISGAIQHVAGMKDSELIIAVNRDPSAPIFSVSHYGVIADMFEIAKELRKLYPTVVTQFP